MRIIRLALVVLGLSSAAHTHSAASEPERAPLANAVGRFWGFGYSAGYHARYESRFGWNRHVPAHSAAIPAFPQFHLPSISQRDSKRFYPFDNSGSSQALSTHAMTIDQPQTYPSQPYLHSALTQPGQAPVTILESEASLPGSPSATTPPPAPAANGWMRRMLKPYADTPAPGGADASSPSDRRAPAAGSAPSKPTSLSSKAANSFDANSLESNGLDADLLIDNEHSAADDLLAPSAGAVPDSSDLLDR